jgi:hypothetical protein
LWSNYILYCFIISEILPGHTHAQFNPLHQFLAHFVQPFILKNSCKFLSSAKCCEGSTLRTCPIAMKFMWHMGNLKWCPCTKFQENSFSQMSTTSRCLFLDQIVVYEGTISKSWWKCLKLGQ